MFLPRALKLKHAKAAKKPATPQTAPEVSLEAAQPASLRSQGSAAQKESEQPEQSSKPRGSRFATAPTTDEHLAQLACGIELIFTDYAQQENDGSKWLQNHYRVQDGEEDFIHLSAFLDHPNISTLKPAPTLISLQAALAAHCPSMIELSTNHYYIRRKPSTYALSFIPKNSFEHADDGGLRFWDQRTIYVEPHTRDLCKTPAKVAHWLKEHGQMREKWLPIQAIHTIRNQCAFVVLSGNVTHEDMWNKWRELKRPESWIIMTKVEHTKRTKEYIALVEAEKAAYKKQKAEQQNRRWGRSSTARNTSYDSIADAPGAPQPHLDLSIDDSAAPTTSEARKTKKKKNNRKRTQDDLAANDAETTNNGDTPVPSNHFINAPNRTSEGVGLNKRIRFDE